MGTKTEAPEDEGLEITELEKFEVTRIDGVANPANGAPILLMKALAGLEPPTQTGFKGPYGGVTPPAPGADGGAGCGCCPNCKCPPAAAKSAPEGIAAQAAAAAKAVLDAYASIDGDWSYMDGPLVKRTFTADQRRDLAARGQALADGSYPIENAEDLGNAASLARSGHGNVTGAKKLIGKMARKLGVRNPLKKKPKSGGAAKATVAEGGAVVDTGAQDGLTKAVQDAVTKATEPLAKEIADLKSARDHLQGELAKVQALPQPGGPVMSAVRPGNDTKGVQRIQLIAKAEEYEGLARTMTSPSDQDAYAKLAAQARRDAEALAG